MSARRPGGCGIKLMLASCGRAPATANICRDSKRSPRGGWNVAITIVRRLRMSGNKTTRSAQKAVGGAISAWRYGSRRRRRGEATNGAGGKRHGGWGGGGWQQWRGNMGQAEVVRRCSQHAQHHHFISPSPLLLLPAASAYNTNLTS
jgi:hypothetical protein